MSETIPSKLNWNDIIKGYFTPQSLRKYILILYTLFVLCVVLAYIFFQLNYIQNYDSLLAQGLEPHSYSFLTDTFSYLGSYNLDKNPQGWIFFSFALWIMAIMFIPLVAYSYRRMVVIDKYGARFATLLLVLGAIGIFLVGVFPDTRQVFFNDLRSGQIHNVVALVAFVGLGIGPLWYGLILCRDNWPWIPKLPWTGPSGQKLFDHKKLRWPFLFLFFVIGCAAYFLIAWEVVWPRDYKPLGIGHWPGEGIYSFPLWEWTLIATLFVVIAWFMLALPYQIPKSADKSESK